MEPEAGGNAESVGQATRDGFELGLRTTECGKPAGAFSLHEGFERFADQLGALTDAADQLSLLEEVVVEIESGAHATY